LNNFLENDDQIDTEKNLKTKLILN